MAKTTQAPPPKHRKEGEIVEQQQGDAFDQVIQHLENSIAQIRGFRDSMRAAKQAFLGSFGGPVALPAPSNALVSAALPASKNKPAEAEDKKVKPTERNYANQISLREAVWKVLDRPEHAEGLKVSQIVEIIEKEGIWKTEGDLANMVQGQVYKLKERNKLVRGDNKRYYIPEGATLGEADES